MKVIKSINVDEEVWELARKKAKENFMSISSLFEYFVKTYEVQRDIKKTRRNTQKD